MSKESTQTGEAAQEKFSSGQEHLKQAAEDLKAAAGAKATELKNIAESKATEIKGKAEHAFSDAKTKVRTLQEDGESFVRENPTKAVLYALGVGFALGLIFRR